jgi:hypothetical protein
MRDFFIKLVSDESGNISSNRFVNVLIGICSCGMMWKMVILGQADASIWGLWLAYGGGIAGWGKFVESKGKGNAPVKDEDTPDPSLKPPKA